MAAKLDGLEHFLKAWDEMGLTRYKIARFLNCGGSELKKKMDELGLEPRVGRATKREIEEMKQKIRILNEMGFNDVEIASILGENLGRIRWHRKKLGLPAVGHTCCSMLKRYIAWGYGEVITLVASGLSDWETVRKTGVKLRTVQNIRRALMCGEISIAALSELFSKKRDENDVWS